MINIPEETANLLIGADKKDWVKQRKGLLFCQGERYAPNLYWQTILNERSPISKNHPSADPTIESALPDTGTI
jgi:hypothetical protein